MMAGSVTLTATDVGALIKASIAWVSDAAGAVSGNAVTLPNAELWDVEYIPDAGATQPTDLYDLTMTGPGVGTTDLLGGTGANLSNANSTHVVPVISTYFRRYLTAGSYTLVAANAGNAKGGTVNLYLRPM